MTNSTAAVRQQRCWWRCTRRDQTLHQQPPSVLYYSANTKIANTNVNTNTNTATRKANPERQFIGKRPLHHCFKAFQYLTIQLQEKATSRSTSMRPMKKYSLQCFALVWTVGSALHHSVHCVKCVYAAGAQCVHLCTACALVACALLDRRLAFPH